MSNFHPDWEGEPDDDAYEEAARIAEEMQLDPDTALLIRYLAPQD